MSDLEKLQHDVDEWVKRMRTRKAVRGVTITSQELAQNLAAAAGVLREAGEAFSRFGLALYAAAETQYLAIHGHLPGSTRTKRLRKKRRDKVTRWFQEQAEHR